MRCSASEKSDANRMMTAASPQNDGIEVFFADGRSGLIPFKDLPEVKERVALSSIQLPNPYEMILQTNAGDRVEISWDFARHYCDESYKARVEAIAMHGRRTLGKRIRQLREAVGYTQDALAVMAGIGRITLVRLENGEQSPRLKTLNAVAGALDKNVQELLLEPEFLIPTSP